MDKFTKNKGGVTHKFAGQEENFDGEKVKEGKPELPILDFWGTEKLEKATKKENPVASKTEEEAQKVKALPVISYIINKADGTKINLTGIPLPYTFKERLERGRKEPEINKMIGDVWKSGELHCSFGDTGAGKSVMAIGWAIKIAKGEDFLNLENECGPQTVIYYDFELSDRQFFERFGINYIDIPNNLFVINLDIPALISINPTIEFTKLLFAKFEDDINRLKAQVVFFDNIQYLTMLNTSDRQTAKNIMLELDRVKKTYHISIAVIGHTRKTDLSSPLTLNDLSGSKDISNFCDSVSVIGKSAKDPNLRYFKQCKASRSGKWLYNSENVMNLRLELADYLKLQFEGFGTEWEHLQSKKPANEDRNAEMKLQALEYHKEGKTIRQIAELTGKGKSIIGEWIMEFKKKIK